MWTIDVQKDCRDKSWTCCAIASERSLHGWTLGAVKSAYLRNALHRVLHIYDSKATLLVNTAYYLLLILNESQRWHVNSVRKRSKTRAIGTAAANAVFIASHADTQPILREWHTIV